MNAVKNKGFSLPELVVALGLVGGISLVVMKLIQNQMSNEVMLKSRAEIQKTTSIIKGILNNPQKCSYMLRNSILPTDQNVQQNVNAPVSIGTLPDQNPTVPGLYERIREHSSNRWFYRQLLIPNSRYQNFRTGNISLQRPTNGADGVADVILEFHIEKKTFILDFDNSNDTRVINRIPVVVNLNGTTVTDCGPVVSAVNIEAKRKFCMTLGNMAQWDSSANTCRFKTSMCKYGEVAIQMDSAKSDIDGVYTCRPINQQMRANDLFNTSSSCQISANRGFRIQAVGQRFEIVCL